MGGYKNTNNQYGTELDMPSCCRGANRVDSKITKIKMLVAHGFDEQVSVWDLAECKHSME
jgi:hypothetical protein